MFQGTQLVFYTQQNHQHAGQPLHSWLLAEAQRTGLQGGSAHYAAEGFGRHRRMHAAHFFELADQPVEIVFILSTEQARLFLEHLRQEKVSVFYVCIPVEYGVLGEKDA